MYSIYGLTRKKLEEELVALGEKPFRATQLFEWLYRKQVSSFDDMSNIAKSSIEKLKNSFDLKHLDIINKQVSSDGTRKYLFSLEDGNAIETVVMMHDYGISVCVSSQVGCRMGCKFCASGEHGKVRDLTVSEMVLQILIINDELSKEDKRISHVVIMGIGEPFENYDNVLDFIRIINDAKGLEIGSRHITVSTCGLVPKIYDFCNFELQVNLAISLHFPNNELRDKYMPINKAYCLEELSKALLTYFKKTSRRVTFEYILLDKINDTDACLNELADFIKKMANKGFACYVNLIPMNETNGMFKRSTRAKPFLDGLLKRGIDATLRKEFGTSIDAACGQLRNKALYDK